MKKRISHLARILIGTVAISLVPAFAIGAGGTAPAIAAQPQSPQAGLPQVAPGFHIEVYAQVAQPMKLSFAPDGALFVGREGGNDRIHKVAPGGRPVVEFGPPQTDPDSVLVDDAGRISGHRHSVLVGGNNILAAIYQNQQSAVIFNSGFDDVDDMQFDRTGRLIFASDDPLVYVSTGGPPAVLFSTPGRADSITFDEDNRIFIALDDGTIRIYLPNGTPAGIFASGLAPGLNTYIAFGQGAGGFGKFLYALSGSTLLRINGNGKATVIGSGFSVGPGSGTGFTFGPDHALYVSDYTNNRILRVSRGNGH